MKHIFAKVAWLAFLLVMVVFLTLPVAADDPFGINGKKIETDTLDLDRAAKLNDDNVILFDKTVEISSLILHDISGEVTFEVDLMQYTKRDGTHAPTSDWDFGAYNLTNVGNLEASSFDGDGSSIDNVDAETLDGNDATYFAPASTTYSKTETDATIEAYTYSKADVYTQAETDATLEAYAYSKAAADALLDNKADTIPLATEDNFAAFDSEGNLKDSGNAAADFLAVDGTDAMEGDLDLDGYDLIDGGHANFSGTVECQNLHVYGTAELGSTSGRAWYDEGTGKLHFSDDHVNINITDLEAAISNMYTKPETDATIEAYSYSKTETDDLIDALAASDIENDSTVSGLTVSDALDNLETAIAGQGSVFDQMKAFAANAINKAADVVLTTEGAGDLQTALNALSEGEVLEIKSNATFTPVVLNTSEITIKVADGYNAKITGEYGITLADGLENVVVSGITFDNCSTAAQNYKGACVTFGAQGSKISNVIFSNVNFSNVASGSAVMLSYHGFTDAYYADIYESECSSKVGFIDCNFWNAGQELTEGAQLCMRAIEKTLISGCKFNADTGTARGINLQGVIDTMIENNYVINSTVNGGEGIKIDCIGEPQFRNTAVIRNNQVKNCLEGIDADDAADCLIHNNIVWDCIQVGISVDGGSSPKNSFSRIIGNEVFNSLVGVRLESGCSAEVRQNIVYNNGTDFSILNGYVLPSDNSIDATDSVLGRTASNTSYTGTVAGDNVKEAIDQLDTDKADTSSVPTVLNDLSNVNVSAPSDGESLVWNAAQSEWTSEAVSMDTSFYRTYYVAPDGNDSTGDGSFSNPWATPGKLWTAIGQPTSAAEYQQRFRAYFAPGEYTLTGTEIVPYRSIQHLVSGCTFTGNITQEIADEYEYGTSSSLFRAVASFHGQAFGNNNHPAKQTGFIITGNLHLQIESGKTGNTTHDRIVTNTYITGNLSEGASTGTSVTYLHNCRIGGSVTGTSYYFQELDNCRFMGTDFDANYIISMKDCQFSSDEWGANNTVEVSCNNFDGASAANFVDCYFRKTEFNLAAPKTAYFDATSYHSYLNGAVVTGSALTAVQRISLPLNDLSNVVAPSPSDGQALVWDNGNSYWKPGTPAGGGDMLKSVYDVDDNGISDSAEVVYDGVNNSTAAEIRTHLDTDIIQTVGNVETVIDAYSYNSTEVYTKTEIDTAFSNLVLDDISNVNVPSPSDGQVLSWNDAEGEWTSETIAAGVFEKVSDVIRESDTGYDGDFVLGSGQLDDDGSHDSRVLWDQSLAAFRAGQVAGTQWDEASRGANSAAFGYNCTASGFGSFAAGSIATASNSRAIALGNQNTASGADAVSIGYGPIASGGKAIAIGCGAGANASGDGSMAFGNGLAVSGDNSMAFGMANSILGTVTQNNAAAFMGGNVGIGVLSPSNLLDVGGTVECLDIVCQDTIEANVFKIGHASGYISESGGNLRLRDGYENFTLSEAIAAIDEKTTPTEVENIISEYSYDSTEVYTKSETYATAEAAISAASLNDLDDVDVPSPTDGYVLTWDEGTSKWTAEAISSSPVTAGTGTGSIKNNNCNAAGDYSTALGSSCSSATEGSVALGYSATATNTGYGYSMGYITSATGGYGATAIGYNNTASGVGSLALGNNATASGNKSVLINLDSNARTNSQAESMAIMGGNVGVGTLTPSKELDVIGKIRASQSVEVVDANTYITKDGSNNLVLADSLTGRKTLAELAGGGGTSYWEKSGTVIRSNSAEVTYSTDDFVFGSPQLDDDSEHIEWRNRIFFDKSKGAFRAGFGDSQWDTANVGNYSIGIGYRPKASAESSTAIGNGAESTAYGSVAIGSCTVNGQNSTAIGSNCHTHSHDSFAMGRSITVGTDADDAAYSVGIGLDNNGRTLTQANTLAIMGGKVGIADLTPEYELDVTGDINFTGNLREDGNIVSIPTIKAGTVEIEIGPFASDYTTGEVVFNTAFNSIPSVVCNGYLFEDIMLEIRGMLAYEITTAGFKYFIKQSITGTSAEVTCNWMATEASNP